MYGNFTAESAKMFPRDLVLPPLTRYGIPTIFGVGSGHETTCLATLSRLPSTVTRQLEFTVVVVSCVDFVKRPCAWLSEAVWRVNHGLRISRAVQIEKGDDAEIPVLSISIR